MSAAAPAPLLPALGYWTQAPQLFGNYSLLLFTVGLVYVMLAMLRNKYSYVIAAVVAGNAAIWALMHDTQISILSHPQFWLIPPALSILVAAQLNRRRLNDKQLTAIRYLTISVIYVSSTGEMFIQGIGDSLWPPMLLSLFALAGIFVGICTRVRAFLYMGFSFLVLSMVSMVWHASQRIDHVWPWWAFGIVVGILVLTVFGLFEKKRNEMLQVVDQLRQWER